MPHLNLFEEEHLDLFDNHLDLFGEEKDNEDRWTEPVVSTAIQNYAGRTLKRTAGVTIGTLNAPLAAGWGGATAPLEYPEEYAKLSWWERPLVVFGGALHSAYESITKEGEYGTLYGDYYEKVRGKTIRDDIVSGLGADESLKKRDYNKYAAKMTAADVLADTAEILGNVVSDPLILPAEALNIAKLKWKKGKLPTGKMDKKVADAIFKAERLEGEQRKALQQHLLDVVKTRQSRLEYDAHVNRAAADFREQAGKVGKPLLRQGEREIPGLTAPRQAMAGQPKRDIAQEVATEVPEVSQLIDKARTVGRLNIPSETGGAYVAKTKINAFRSKKGLESIKGIPKDEIAATRGEMTLDKLNEYRQKKGLPKIDHIYHPDPISAKMSSGMVLGIEEDEEGNLGYNIGAGLAGGLAVVGGIRAIRAGKSGKLQKMLAENPALKKVHESIGKRGGTFEWAGLFPRLWKGFRERITDRFAALEKASPETYLKASTFRSYADDAYLKFQDLETALEPVRKDEFLFTNYIAARRDITRAERGFKNPGDVSLPEARKAIDEIESVWTQEGKNIDDLRASADLFQEWTHENILKPMLDSGVISRESYESIVRDNKWYATFDILDHMDDDLAKLPSGFNSSEWFSKPQQRVVKPLKGTVKQMDNPIDATIRKFTESQGTAAQNRVASTLVDDPLMATQIRPLAENAKQYKILQNMGKDPIATVPKGFDTISRFKDGQVEKYVVPKEIAGAMKQLTPWQAPKWVQAYHAVFRGAATTYRIPFLIGNVPRDALMAYVSSPVYKGRDVLGKFQMDWLQGAWEAAKTEFPALGKARTAEDFIKNGGGFGYSGAEAFDVAGKKLPRSVLFEKSGLRKTVDVVTSPAVLIKKINQIAELAPRLGIYKRAQKLGYSSEEAAMLGRRGTIDFNKGGRWTKAANQWIPFLNARVQARTVFANAVKTDTGNTFAKVTTAALIPGLATYAFNKLYFNDLYEDIPDYIKDDYFIMIYGSEENDEGKTVPKAIAVAKGDIGQMAVNPWEFGLEQKWKEDPEAAKKFLTDFISDYSPVEFAQEGELSATRTLSSVVPPMGKAAIEPATNKNLYTGYDIVPRRLQEGPAELRYKENTPELYKLMGKAIGVSPPKLQAIGANILAGYGREGLSPKAFVDSITGRVIKKRGGAKDRRMIEEIKTTMTEGYETARAYAERAVLDDDKKTANDIMVKWNIGFVKTLLDFGKKYDVKNMSGLRKSHMFSMQKRKNILNKKPDKRSYLEKKLTGR